MKKIALTLILCSRNDQYMGNSRWRLQTTLNYVAQKILELSREEEVEILVSDWGSDIPLREVLELSSTAARMVSFIQVPPEIARDLQKDSPFSDALALNTVARRAHGEYIGRIDQDTLVGKRFLRYFFELYEGRQLLGVPMSSALLFANQRMVPYRFCVRCPSLWAVEKFIDCFGRSFKIEISPGNPFYHHGVGIWLLHRDLWYECGGYDERMIYMNNTEINMIARLKMKEYEVVNLGKLVDYDFYHIEHYHPLGPRKSSKHRKVNPETPFLKPDLLNPNGRGWGFVQYSFEKLPYSPYKNTFVTGTSIRLPFRWLFFLLLLIPTGLQVAWDELVKFLKQNEFLFRKRAQSAWVMIRGKPIISWPQQLKKLWVRKKRDQRYER